VEVVFVVEDKQLALQFVAAFIPQDMGNGRVL